MGNLVVAVQCLSVKPKQQVSRNSSAWQKEKEFLPAGNFAGKGEYGNVYSGSIFYVTKMILTGMSIIFIGILLNMAGQKEQVIDLAPAFIVMLNKASIPRIGDNHEGYNIEGLE